MSRPDKSRGVFNEVVPHPAALFSVNPPSPDVALNQATHAVDEVFETYAHPRPYKTDTANQSPVHVVALRPEDMLYPYTKPATTLVARFLPVTQQKVAMDLAHQSLGLHRRFNGFRPAGTVRPHTACRVV